MEGNGQSEKIRRFGLYQIIEHWVTASIFTVLVITGLTQRFYDLSLSQLVVITLGGIDAVRLLHRATGFALLLAAAQHILVSSFAILSGKWIPHMMIERKDLTDGVQNLKYYLGMTERPASCDRYTYKQKFQYWAILLGGIVMVISGFVLWFPMTVTKFLPGEIIPAAKALHTNEAMLIFLLIALWHVYNAIFTPEVFPLDTSMITGYISKERMASEHPLELARLEGRQADDPSRRSAGSNGDTEAIDLGREEGMI